MRFSGLCRWCTAGPSISVQKSLIVIVFFAKRKRLGTPRKRHSVHGSVSASFATLLYSLFSIFFLSVCGKCFCTSDRAQVCEDSLTYVYAYLCTYCQHSFGASFSSLAWLIHIDLFAFWLYFVLVWAEEIEKGPAREGQRGQTTSMAHTSYANAIQLSIP